MKISDDYDDPIYGDEDDQKPDGKWKKNIAPTFLGAVVPRKQPPYIMVRCSTFMRRQAALAAYDAGFSREQWARRALAEKISEFNGMPVEELLAGITSKPYRSKKRTDDA